MKTEHTLVIQKDCKVLKQRSLLLEALSKLPEDVEILDIAGTPGVHNTTDPGAIRLRFATEKLGEVTDTFNFVLCEQVKLVRSPGKYG